MSQIVIGKSAGRNVSILLEVLLATRLLIQANSGGGKSWLLRRLAEQLYGKVPVIIIDPEGEFASLREKFDYFLVGEGGDTPAHERSAALLAETLLKLRANAVCDLYETFRKNPLGRHLWVKTFLGGLLDAPKSLWRPTVVIVDEAHMFCPEKGESPAEGVMVGLATAGRKRHFCPIWATQRLALLSKDGSSQLQNRMVGLTFEDVDVDRAAALLSVGKDEVHEFKKQVKTLDPGNFFAFGRAISKERILVTVGPVETSHEAETGKAAAMEPPPPPEAIKALLPKLADLPKTAEERAHTEAELRAEIRALKAQVRNAAAKSSTTALAGPVPIRQAVRKAEDAIIAQAKIEIGVLKLEMFRFAKSREAFAPTRTEIPGGEIQSKGAPQQSGASIVQTGGPQHPRPDVSGLAAERAERPTSRSSSNLEARSNHSNGASNDDGELRPKKLGILKAIAEFEAIGRASISKSWIAARSGQSYTSSAYGNNLGYLRSGGFISYPGPDLVALTEKGRAHAGEIRAPETSEEMLASCLQLLMPAQQKILKALYERYPAEVNKNELAELAQASATSSAFGNNLGALRSAGMIDYPGPGVAKAADWLFLE